MDRFLTFKIKKWPKVYFGHGVASLVTHLMVMLIFALNSSVLFTFGYQYEEANSTEIITQCFTISTIPNPYWMKVWNNVNQALFETTSHNLNFSVF